MLEFRALSTKVAKLAYDMINSWISSKQVLQLCNGSVSYLPRPMGGHGHNQNQNEDLFRHRRVPGSRLCRVPLLRKICDSSDIGRSEISNVAKTHITV